jgi:UDP-N-acetylmuramate--alanine ligase
MDDDGVACILPRLQRRVITYGLSEQCTTRATDLDANEQLVSYTLMHKQVDLGRITLRVPGEHNVRNSLAAASMALEIGIDPDVIREALGEFRGVYRRFEIKGEVNGVLVIDDYAHHPTEITATLSAARAGWDRRLIAIFQPHTYTRTRDFFQAFAESFSDADVLIITDVYPAREAPIEGVSGALIADAARAAGHPDVRYVPLLSDVRSALGEVLKPGDVVLTMGAGDIWKVSSELLG